MEIEKTINKVFRRSVKLFGPRPAFRYKKDETWHSITYEEAGRFVENLGVGLISHDVKVNDNVAILSYNRPEWAMADLAIVGAGGVSVPLYHTLNAAQIQYIIEQSECEIVFAENAEQLDKVIKIKDKLPRLRLAILMSGEPQVSLPWVLTFDQIIKLGADSPQEQHDEYLRRCEARQPDDLLTIIYTSGTTGIPKGVVLTHKNLCSNISGTLDIVEVTEKDTCLSFLPLSHVLERMGGYYLMIACGVAIGYAETMLTVPNNLVEVRPSLVVSVPRLYEKMYAKISEKIEKSSKIQRLIFTKAVEVGRKHYDATSQGKVDPILSLQHKVMDLLVYSKIRQQLGGNLRFFISGGAPLEKKIAEFFAACGVMIYEGYGLTETSPVTNVNRPGKVKFGTVGPTIPGVEVMIAEDGEILVKGPSVMKGYYKMPQETAEVFTPDGWFKTGDIGVIDADGFLRITDRKKELIVTSGGKNIAPQPLENMFKTSRFISQVMVIGDRHKYLTALFVPDFERLVSWAKDQGIAFKDWTELVAHPFIVKTIENDVEEMQKDLPRYEQLKKFTLLDGEFTIDGGELTPTLKIKRKVIMEKYQKAIAKMYEGE